MDGHRSHISVDLIEWAKEQGIIIFILPAHTSHILQPMDVACYGPLQAAYKQPLSQEHKDCLRGHHQIQHLQISLKGLHHRSYRQKISNLDSGKQAYILWTQQRSQQQALSLLNFSPERQMKRRSMKMMQHTARRMSAF